MRNHIYIYIVATTQNNTDVGFGWTRTEYGQTENSLLQNQYMDEIYTMNENTKVKTQCYPILHNIAIYLYIIFGFMPAHNTFINSYTYEIFQFFNS